MVRINSVNGLFNKGYDQNLVRVQSVELTMPKYHLDRREVIPNERDKIDKALTFRSELTSYLHTGNIDCLVCNEFITFRCYFQPENVHGELYFGISIDEFYAIEPGVNAVFNSWDIFDHKLQLNIY